MKLIFFNIKKRTVDSRDRSLDDYRNDSEEMIGSLRKFNGRNYVTCHNRHGRFVFHDPQPSEISPYVSLAELTRVHFVDGHFQVG